MVGQDRMQLRVMLSTPTGDIERGLYLTSFIRQAPIECDVKNVIEIEIYGIKRGQIREAVKRLLERVFLLSDEYYYIVNNRFIEDAAGAPNEEIGIRDIRDIGRQIHDNRVVGDGGGSGDSTETF